MQGNDKSIRCITTPSLQRAMPCRNAWHANIREASSKIQASLSWIKKKNLSIPAAWHAWVQSGSGIRMSVAPVRKDFLRPYLIENRKSSRTSWWGNTENPFRIFQMPTTAKETLLSIQPVLSKRSRLCQLARTTKGDNVTNNNRR